MPYFSTPNAESRLVLGCLPFPFKCNFYLFCVSLVAQWRCSLMSLQSKKRAQSTWEPVHMWVTWKVSKCKQFDCTEEFFCLFVSQNSLFKMVLISLLCYSAKTCRCSGCTAQHSSPDTTNVGLQKHRGLCVC